jgi:hypothetical protein
MAEEQHAEQCHRERLDQPIDDERQREALRAAADVADREPVDLDHHRIDHHPDERGDDEIDVRNFKCGNRSERPG